MAKKQKSASSKLASGLPVAPWVLINNSLGPSSPYAEALCSLIPQSHVHDCFAHVFKPHDDLSPDSIYIVARTCMIAHDAAKFARAVQVKTLKEGYNMASVTLCNDSTFGQFSAVNESDWPSNHININIGDAPMEEVAKRILKWLFTVLSVRETLRLIPESEMLAIDTKNFADYKYCALKEARKHRKDEKLQFVALVASKPEITEPNKLSWKVVDRSGEANFYFHHRGPTSQQTWDLVLGLKVGDRKVLPRMPMIALHEPIAKKILLSPLRATGATIRGVGHMTMGIGKGVHWVGDKVSIRRSEDQKFIAEADWVEEVHGEERKKERERANELKKKQYMQKFFNRCNRNRGVVREEAVTENKGKVSDFKIFNEKGEKTWKDSEDDTASTVAASLVDEKIEKEFF